MFPFLLLLALVSSKPIPEDLGNGFYYIGVNDDHITLFEGQYPVKNGMAYNSYMAKAKSGEIAIFDTVDVHFANEWLAKIEHNLKGQKPKYLIIHHMEPDHAGSIGEFMKKYPETTVVSSRMAFVMMNNFFGTDFKNNRKVVKEGDILRMGQFNFYFVEAPMVHWPEVFVTYEINSKTLFSADGFGKFGSNNKDEPWDDESRRYFIGIVGKFGDNVMDLLKKAGKIQINTVYPTHGPILTENLGHYIDLYVKWASYTPEEDGVVIAYSSVYGHTEDAVKKLAESLGKKGKKVVLHDLNRVDPSYVVADAFRYSKLVLASVTYMGDVFPSMKGFIDHLVSRNFKNRKVGFIENGSWSPTAEKVMRDLLKNCENLDLINVSVKLRGSVTEDNVKEIENLAESLA